MQKKTTIRNAIFRPYAWHISAKEEEKTEEGCARSFLTFSLLKRPKKKSKKERRGQHEYLCADRGKTKRKKQA